MTFNVTKCKTRSITRKRNPIYHQYSMNNQPLESVRNHPYLGVEVTQYASTVWSPHQKYQIDKLEAVQRKAARFIKNCWSREQGTVTKLLADLKWDTLQVRREKGRLLMFYKATHGLVDIPLPDTLIPLSVRNTRQYHPKKFYPVVPNTKSYKGTFFQAQLLCGIVFHPVSWTNQTSPNLDKL